MNPKEKDDEIIELTDKELDEIFADDDFDVGQPIGGRIFHHNVALVIERKLSLGGIVGARLDLGIGV